MTVRLPFSAPRDLPAAVAAVRIACDMHGIAAIPTETYYGLAADPRDQQAVDRIFRLKGRPAVRALPVVGASLEQLDALVIVPAPWRERLAGAWPAALTVVLPAREPLPAGGPTLAVRVPAHDLLRGLLARVGPLTATSANRSGEPPTTEPSAVMESLGAGLELLLDGGVTPGEAPSTVLDCTAGVPIVLRAGRWIVPASWGVKAG